MKLVYITTKITGAGGMQRVVVVKANYLAEKGYGVTIVVTNAEEGEEMFYKVYPEVKVVAVTPVRTGLLSYLFSYKKMLNRAVSAICPDIVIMCDNGIKSYFAPFLLNCKIPIIYEMHTSRYIEESAVVKNKVHDLKNSLINTLKKFCASKFDKFVVLTPRGATEWDRSNIEIIPNPLWLTADNTAALKNKTAIAIGRHSYEKGYDRMFAIWKQVTLKHPDWVLEVYGDDNPEYDLRKIAKDNGLVKEVKFLKPVRNIAQAYNKASICLMTSYYEGFGMVLLEAMTCGVPCVAFDCPTGPSGIIEDGQNGYLVTDGDLDAFINTVNTLIENNELRDKLGKMAKHHSTYFSLEKIMDQWENLFRDITKNKDIPTDIDRK